MPLSFVVIIACGLVLYSSDRVGGLDIPSSKKVDKFLEKDFYFHQYPHLGAKDIQKKALKDEYTNLGEGRARAYFVKAGEHDSDVKKYHSRSYGAEKSRDSVQRGKRSDWIHDHDAGPRIYADEIKIHAHEAGEYGDKFVMLDDSVLEDAEGTNVSLNSSEIVYTAAVLEFEAYREWTDGGSETIYKKNVHSFEFYATQAKLMGTDILVFPEYGLEGLDHGTRNDSVFQALTLPVPSPSARVAPCDFGNEDYFDPMQKLSCLARRLELYLVVDLAEREQTSLQDGNGTDVYYNTQVVFDRSGVVVARYRKRHLFAEPKFEPGPETDEAALFTTDFGVTFSLQICFDILFAEPSYANVQRGLTRDIITSTAWIDHAPFNMAPNVQNEFSRSLGVNLLVANYHWPELGKLGSGVYLGYSDLSNVYTYDEHSGNVLVVSPVRTILSAPPQQVPSAFLSRPRVLKYRRSADASRLHTLQDANENLMRSSDVLTPTPPHSQHQNQVSVCFRDLCCYLNYYYFTTDELIYRLVAYDGYYPTGNGLLYLQVCGLLWCDSTDMNTCAILEPKPSTLSDFFGPFALSGNFSSDVTFPSAMMRNSSLVPNQLYGFEEKTSGFSEIEFNAGAPNLAMAYILGRKYSADLP